MNGHAVSPMSIVRRVIASGLLLLLALIAVPTGAPAGTVETALDSEEQALFDLLNQYRAEQGSPPLVLEERLTEAAEWMANDMAEHGHLSHIDSLGRDPNERAAAFGYPGTVGENLARSHFFHTAQNVFNAWKQSSGHNANMLNPLWNVVGVGRAYSPDWGWHWAIDLGRLSSLSTPTPSSSPTAAATVSAAPIPTPIPSPTPTPTPTPAPALSFTPEPPRHVVGDSDCDGLITTADSLHVLRDAAGLETEADCLALADSNCDSVIDIVDALNILRWIVGLSVAAPPGCVSVGAQA